MAINRKIVQYNDLVYESGPIKFNDYVSNNPNKIHSLLYEKALKDFINEYCLSHLYNDVKNGLNCPDDDIKKQSNSFILANSPIYRNENEIYPNYNIDINDDFSLNKFLEDSRNEFLKNTYILEKYNDEYWMPSSILIYHDMGKMMETNSISHPSIYIQEISLSKWWNHTQDKNKYKVQNVKVSENILNDPQVKYLDYVKGKAIVNDKSIPELDFKIDFDIINEDINISDEYLLNDFFGLKL